MPISLELMNREGLFAKTLRIDVAFVLIVGEIIIVKVVQRIDTT
jgi:hypothetical protein